MQIGAVLPHNEIGTDPEAFEALYREHLGFVRSFVARRVADPHTAADLTSEIFLAVIESAHGYRASSGAPVAWLAGVARNVVAGHARRQARELRAVSRVSGRALLDDASLEQAVSRTAGVFAGVRVLRLDRRRGFCAAVL